MKTFVTVIFFIAIFGNINCVPLKKDVDLAEKIRMAIEKMIAVIPDSIAIKDVDIKIPSNILINGDFNITEISISGLKNLNIETLTFDESKGQLDYVFNFVDIITIVETDLHMTGLVKFDHPLSVHVDFKDFKTKGHALLAEDRKSVEDFKILINLGESDFDIKGLVNNDKLSKDVSKFLTENVAKIIDEIAPVVSPAVSEIIKIAINVILKIVK
ncbi:uncharacterized protein LOC108903586 isoform X2 [Anoplophora glabripennis]|uniref:uncharacterized protein LOC108903586 isoform X2 n=1 Tax=Anoplophora glabripennis TaxID=217634 RepID=UPI000873BC3D|nr:uncharacterized protein LOC108903586 isoform X2 [Anoplophora glabripennis]